MLKSLQLRIKEDELALAKMMASTNDQKRLMSLPGMGPILAAVVVNEIDGCERFRSATKFSGYAGLCPSTSSSGGKTYNGKLIRHCNKWLRWAFVEAAWMSIGCSGCFGDIYKQKRARGKKANTAILCVARRMARIAWQMLTQKRSYETLPPRFRASPSLRRDTEAVAKAAPASRKKASNPAKSISPAAPIAI